MIEAVYALAHTYVHTEGLSGANGCCTELVVLLFSADFSEQLHRFITHKNSLQTLILPQCHLGTALAALKHSKLSPLQTSVAASVVVP
jgi:hypothetical protein